MKKSSLRNSQETSGPPDRVPGEGLRIRISTDDVLEAHAMKDVGKEKDNHVGMFRREGGGIGRGGSSWGGKEGHVWRGVRTVEEGPGREGEPDVLLSSGSDVEHPASGGEREVGVGVGPKLEEVGEGDVSVPGVVNDDGGGGEDCIETKTCPEAEDVVDVMAVDGGDDALVMDAEEEVVVNEEVSPVLQETECTEGLTVEVEASEGGEGKGVEGLGKEVVLEVDEVAIVCGAADGAHDGVVDKALRIGIIGTGVHVRGNVGDVEGACKLGRVVVMEGAGVERRGVGGVMDRIDVEAWKEEGKDGIGILVKVRVIGGVDWVVAVEGSERG